MDGAAIDNDILYKGAWYGLLGDLVLAIPCEVAKAAVLGHAKYVVGKRLQREHKRGIADADSAAQRLHEIVSQVVELEPSPDEISIAALFENAAQEAGLPLDEGESLLCAIVVSRGLNRMATGDKRAIKAIEALLPKLNNLVEICGKLVCLEQLVLELVFHGRSAEVRAAVCRHPHVDGTLTLCFGCSSTAPDSAIWTDGLESYIRDLRASAPTVLKP